MPKRPVFLAALLLAAAVLDAHGHPGRAETPAQPVCSGPKEYTRLQEPLLRTALALAAGDPIVIVAVGSSSTAGAGASSPAASYPSRLEAELKASFPGTPIAVINRGVNGEEAPQMMARFAKDVIAEKPDLVLWQVGTNGVLRDHVEGREPLLRKGIRELKAAQADVVLIDPQYAPKVIVKPDAPAMVQIIDHEARRERIGIFHRYALMRHWHRMDKIPFRQILSPDGLHMNDWSYGCLAKLLAAAIVDAARGHAEARATPHR
jgi:lysophospholipase L1-like esterase